MIVPPADITALTFKAKVAAADFSCDQTYSAGTTQTPYTPRDFRMFVSDLSFGTADGGTAPFTLTNDAAFQNDGLAMLDFENGRGSCSNGTADMHTTLTGLAQGGSYRSLSFTIGVPFEKNHQEATTASAPLSSTAMFWSWTGGYKFLKIEGTTTGLPMGHNIHVGSTGCQSGATPNSVTSCDKPNRSRITIDFDPYANQTVVFDLGALVADSNLDTNLAMSPPGCMSGAADTDCAPIFARLGLPFGDALAGAQSFVRVE